MRRGNLIVTAEPEMKKRLPHIITHKVDVETETHESLWPLADVSEIGKKNMVNEEQNLGIPSSEKSAEADAGSELLPCPFCGASAKGERKPVHMVHNKGCYLLSLRRTPEEWNTRASTTQDIE